VEEFDRVSIKLKIVVNYTSLERETILNTEYPRIWF